MSITNETDTTSKLVRTLAVIGTDKSIDKYTHTFEFEDDDGNVTTKDEIIVAITELEPTLKGLKFRFCIML